MILLDEVFVDQAGITAPGWSFRYSEAVSSISIFARASLGTGMLACAACAGLGSKSDAAPVPEAFYTVTAEIALARHEPRVAAQQYAAAAAQETDPGLLERAAQVAADGLQPALAERIAARWLSVQPESVAAHHAAGKAALALDKIEQAARHYRAVLELSSLGTDAEFAELETELGASDNIYGARRLADLLATAFPDSQPALRVQGFAALRADDPAAAVRSLAAAVAVTAPPAPDDTARRELLQALARARILAGDVEPPLQQARDAAAHEDTPASRLDYALLLMAAQRDAQATQQLELLARQGEYGPVALRLLGLIEFQEGRLDAAADQFTQLLRADKYLDDAFYYLGLIADRHNDLEGALRLYAQVQNGENSVPALLRATAILERHGAAEAAEQLLDRLIEEEPQRAPDILTARARIYADGGDFARARAVLEQGVAEYPDIVDLQYAEAALNEEDGRVADALRELTVIVNRRPDDPSALNALGYTLADHSRELRRARRLIESAHAAAPRNPAIMDSMGWVLFRQGHEAQALPYLQTAYADDPGGDIAAHLGEVLWRLGRPAEAERVWDAASAADGDNRLLKETRERFQRDAPAATRPAPTVE